MPRLQRHVLVCVNERPAQNPKGCCLRKGGAEVLEAFKKALNPHCLKGVVRVNSTNCLGQCAAGVTVVIYPEQTWYGQVTVKDVPEIVAEHILEGRVVQRLLMAGQDTQPYPAIKREATIGD